MKTTYCIFLILLTSGINSSILRKRIIRITDRELDEESPIQTNEIDKDQETRSAEIGSHISDQTHDISSASFSHDNENDVKDNMINKKLEKGNEDVLSLKNLDNELHDPDESEEEKRAKKLERFKALHANQSEKSEILTQEKVQKNQKDSLFDKDRVRIDYQKDKDRLKNNALLNINTAQNELADMSKSVSAEQKHIETLEESAINTSKDMHADPIKPDKNPDYKMQTKNNTPGLKPKFINDKSKINDFTTGVDISRANNYDFFKDPEVKENIAEHPETDYVYDKMNDEHESETKKKLMSNYMSGSEMMKRENIKPEVADVKIEEYKYKSLSNQFYENDEDAKPLIPEKKEIDNMPSIEDESEKNGNQKVSKTDAMIDESEDLNETQNPDDASQKVNEVENTGDETQDIVEESGQKGSEVNEAVQEKSDDQPAQGSEESREGYEGIFRNWMTILVLGSVMIGL